MTTTTEGKTVPYIVRREMGTINRAVYSIAFLHEPGTPLPSPWTTGAAWNGRLVYTFGGGVAWGYHQGRTIGGLNGDRGNLEDGQLGDYPVAKGFALAGGSLNVFGTHANDVVSAETMMMVKEHFIEEFGPIKLDDRQRPLRRIDAAAHDREQLSGAARRDRADGELCRHDDVPDVDARLRAARPRDDYVEAAVHDRSEDGRLGLQPLGLLHQQQAALRRASPPTSTATRNTIPQSMRFDPVKKPDGVRCTYQDAFVSVFGRDPKTGFARRPVRQRRRAVRARAPSTPARSTSTSSSTSTAWPAATTSTATSSPTRTVADPDALRIAYETGRVNDGAHGLTMLPIIDMRPYTEGPGGNVHDTFDGVIAGNRIDAAGGGNRISRVYDEKVPIFKAQDDNLDILDTWLAAVARDTAPGSQREKVLRNKPAGAGRFLLHREARRNQGPGAGARRCSPSTRTPASSRARRRPTTSSSAS